MRLRSTVRRVAVVGLTAALGWSAAAEVAAVTPPTTAWWWNGAGGVLPATLPPPPIVPDGGLYVATDVASRRAMSALRFELGGADGVPVILSLQVSSSVGPPSVLACPTTSPWEPTQGDDWASRPGVDCVRSARGLLGDDGSTIEFRVAELADGDVLDIALVPESGTTFHLVLDPPRTDALVVDDDVTRDPDASGPSAARLPLPSSPGAPPALEVEGPSGFRVASPPPGGVPVPSFVSPSPPTHRPERVGAPAISRPVSQRQRDLEPGWIRVVAGLLAGLCVIAYLWLTRGSPSSRLSAVADGEGRRGVGRFRHERDLRTRPPAVS